MANTGLVTNARTVIDDEQLGKFIGGKTALVAQGGGQRGIFTAGVLDAFLLSNFDEFDEFYGTSAGALNLCAYLSRQAGLGKSFILDLTTDPKFFNLFHFIRRKRYLDLKWALDSICDYPYKLDIDMGHRILGHRRAFAATTDTLTLKDHYLPMFQDDWYQVLLATSAIPNLYEGTVMVNGAEYIDGGVSASIPVQEAWRQGSRTIVVIRTEETVTEEPLVMPDQPVVTESPTWFRESLNSLQLQWQEKVDQWSRDWNGFFNGQILKSQEAKHAQHLNLINGGRWLFGAADIYRLSHLFGEKFDSGLADMLMVHYQTYSLTQQFLNNPPDDCFIVQIAPDGPLKTASLLSDVDDILHDYQLGLDAGLQFVEGYNLVNSLNRMNTTQQDWWLPQSPG
ncbi:patatin family protein [Vibrio hangzhouensis]|uniref:patatin-like phospholipase family protein n=1 Tax=Vibrio hangzhouensis TaxID=462991 RepID=UPI001C9441AC|nr:patatin-like phospholipase family protein [Vibrio hangzhouensis]MBY6197487.1 patatin-like phospholipase family protein [Vibrio hangzhouensis]